MLPGRLPSALIAWLLFAPMARAEPAATPGTRVVLPLSGLVLELPEEAKKGTAWTLSASWRLGDTGTGFDGRDVLDEKVGDTLVAGTWVSVGHFAAGDCGKVVRSAAFDAAWESKVKLAGRDASVRGGIYTFEGGALGKKPGVVLCLSRGARKQLLVHRFFLDQPEAMTREAMLAAVGESALLERIVSAWASDRFDASTPPLARPEVRRRGSVEATRAVTLAQAGFTVVLPNDGMVWLAIAGAASDPTDFLDLIAPAEPEVSVEVALVRGSTCADFFAGLGAERRPGSAAKNLPAGWQAGPTILVDGEPELTTCTARGEHALVVGFFVAPFAEDVARYGPLLEALAVGAGAR